jgi:hypothetical protein
MLNLEEGVGLSKSVNSSDTTVFYLRSFSLSVSQLREVFADWDANGHDYKEAMAWKDMIATLRKEILIGPWG